mmetsp:Transcript_780/g.760  ORF Transcript_780/g.760 Transcript_780/m.760 type:complete len:503 (+) Transcript_780:90-1598(+)
MIDNNVLIAIIVVLGINYIYSWYIDSTKDVSDVYLNEQSIIDATRKSDESAIYKSNKLDYSHGLRVGLDIRYNHYKLRNGNLCDVWEVLMNSTSRDPSKEIVIHYETIKIVQLNYMVDKIGHYLKGKEAKKIAINYRNSLVGVEVFCILIACFVNRITINFYDDIDTVENIDYFVIDEQELKLVEDKKYILFNSRNENSVHDILGGKRGELLKFDNEYHPDKDKGTAIQFTRKVNHNVLSNIRFAQINLISGIASTIKHVPLSRMWNDKDTLLVVQSKDQTNESILNEICKIMACFVTNTNVKVTNTTDWSVIKSHNPTILSINESDFIENVKLEEIKPQKNLIKKLQFNQSMKFLSKGKFTTTYSDVLRLIYIQTSIIQKSQLNTLQLNEYRSLLGSRIIMEYGFPNVVGPIIQTDFYDYRIIALNKDANGFGCLSQSIEAKLVNVHNNYGTILIRGYNIGKALNTMNDASRPLADNDGFMPIYNVRGKWGNDGCLYIYNA